MYNGHVDIRMGGRYRDELDAVPTEVTEGIIYDENVEWPSSKVEEAGVTIDFDDLTNPLHGVKALKIGIVANTDKYAKDTLTSELANPITGYARHFDTSEPETEFPILLSDIYPDHKTIVVGDGIRDLIHYSLPAINLVSVIIKNRVTEEEITLRIKRYDTELFGFAGIDQELTIAREVVFTNHLVEIPEGEYDLILDGITRNDQKYIFSGSVFYPADAQAILTAEQAAACLNGNLLLSVKLAAAITTDFGLLLQIYNGGDLKGELTIDRNNLHGFDPASTEYQAMSFPITSFGDAIDFMTKLVIAPVGEWPTVDLFIDYIVLQVTQEKSNIEDQTFEYRDVADGEIYTIDPAASFPYRVIEIVAKTNLGNVSAALKINGAAITGLAAIAAIDANQTFQPTALNDLTNDDVLTLGIDTVTNGATSLIGKVRYIRT